MQTVYLSLSQWLPIPSEKLSIHNLICIDFLFHVTVNGTIKTTLNYFDQKTHITYINFAINFDFTIVKT
jgi:hypothetical protein